ncbi:hypothetical protein HZS_1038 [Henneguya salminicola]|nr:hypothetical protein HZS_1038 [Henneguya salminicola]
MKIASLLRKIHPSKLIKNHFHSVYENLNKNGNEFKQICRFNHICVDPSNGILKSEYKENKASKIYSFRQKIVRGYRKYAFCMRVYCCEVSKVVQIFPTWLFNPTTPFQRRELKHGMFEITRSVPFFVIVAIPFAEFALPFIVYKFPNFLPKSLAQSASDGVVLFDQFLDHVLLHPFT